jgi:hypothetical protein
MITTTFIIIVSLESEQMVDVDDEGGGPGRGDDRLEDGILDRPHLESIL